MIILFNFLPKAEQALHACTGTGSALGGKNDWILMSSKKEASGEEASFLWIDTQRIPKSLEM